MSTLIVQALLQAAANHGLEIGLPEEVGLGGPADESGELSPLPREEAVFRQLAARTGESAFALRAAASLERGAFGGLEYALRSSPTLAEALRMLERFSRLVSAERRFVLRQEPGERLVLVLDGGRESTEPLGAVFALAAIVALGRNAAGISWSPATVRFRHEALAELPRYEEFFEAPIAFAQSEDALVLGPDTCALPMREADPALLRVLEQYLRKELEALDPAQSLEDAVRTAIMRALPEQNADLETIASHVGLSSRVLQKRLQHAGTSFQEVLDRVRESLAKRYLVQPSFSLAATALALGYSDVTAFHRAFKRWTGVTPGDFRRRALREGEQ